ncbi:cupin domain-containing protein [Microbacterium sp.]|uniref:cupin domain-containing protein n=1 Tax=Microbacterium sp. TaxID=51671 RepID=UPI002E324F31|nr:cupin domain-containing protein [Microbacterium sp.]HEX5729610.1 cupin domain-containing protein [Microbacterium sp.]
MLAVLGAATLTACSGILPGAPPEPDEPKISAIDLASGDQVEPVELAVDGGAAGVGVTFREITIQPGAGTGEHCHYGQLIAVVQEGELTHYSETHPGGVRVYRAGESIIEGAGYPHEGRNEGASDVVLWVTYVVPDGKPLAETDLADCEG